MHKMSISILRILIVVNIEIKYVNVSDRKKLNYFRLLV